MEKPQGGGVFFHLFGARLAKKKNTPWGFSRVSSVTLFLIASGSSCGDLFTPSFPNAFHLNAFFMPVNSYFSRLLEGTLVFLGTFFFVCVHLPLLPKQKTPFVFDKLYPMCSCMHSLILDSHFSKI